MNPLTPVAGAEAGGAGLAGLWQQVAAAVGQPMAHGDAGQAMPAAEGAMPGHAAQAGGPAALPSAGTAMPAASDLAATAAGATAAAVASQSPAASLRDRLSPAPHAGALAMPRADAGDGSTAGASAPGLAAPSASATAAPSAASPQQVPAALLNLLALPADTARRRDLPRDEAAPSRRRMHHQCPQEQAGEGDASQDDATDLLDEPILPPGAGHAGPDDDTLDEAPPADSAPALAAWRQLLQHAGRHEALRELALHRHVLLLQPPPTAGHGEAIALTAWLIGGPAGAVVRFPARWWPPAGLSLPAQWRLHRPQGGAEAGLRSRAAAPAAGAATTPSLGCRLLLGPWPRLPDTGCALLGLSQPQRFGRSLGMQWSLLLLVLPQEGA